MAQALEGIRVLDFAIGQQGPYASTMLADMGAEVIKIEEPKFGDFGRHVGYTDQKVNAYLLCHNRGKKSIAIDLKNPKGKEAILRLVKTADVLLQNFRFGALARLGLGYSELKKINPKLIYASATGYGPKGPWRERPAFDITAQAAAGSMSVAGEPGMPQNWVRIPIGDQVGAMVMAYGIMVALFHRERTGVGQEIDASLFGSHLALQAFNITGALISGRDPEKVSRSQSMPMWNTYQCGDGKWIMVACLPPDRYWEQFCRALGREDLISDPLFDTAAKRREYYVELVAVFDQVFATRDADEWTEILIKHDIPCSTVLKYSELANLPQAVENEYIVDYDHPRGGPIKMVGIPIRMSETPGDPYKVEPLHGEHSEEVLMSLGYSEAEIAVMREEGVYRTPPVS